MHFHAGHNTPGYLPEADVETFETFEDAKRYMIEYMDKEGDFFFDYEGSEGKDLADELSGEMEDLNLDNGPEWGTIVGNVSYWINACDDDCDLDECES
jgi:hypothetical protein